MQRGGSEPVRRTADAKLFLVFVNSNLFPREMGSDERNIGRIDLSAAMAASRTFSLPGQTDVGRAISPQQEQRFPIWQSETEDSVAHRVSSREFFTR